MTIVPGIDIFNGADRRPVPPVSGPAVGIRSVKMALFGSAARGEIRPDSDIDVLVELEPDHHLGLFEFDDLQTHLTQIFGRKVDLVSKSGLKPRVRLWVLRDAKIIYAA